MVRLELTEGLIQKLKSRKDLIYSTILKQNLILTQTGSSPADLTKNILEGELSPVLEDAERESIDELFRRIDIQNLSGRSKEYHGDERLRKDESDEELSSENEEAIDWIDHRTILKVVKILRASSSSSGKIFCLKLLEIIIKQLINFVFCLFFIFNFNFLKKGEDSFYEFLKLTKPLRIKRLDSTRLRFKSVLRLSPSNFIISIINK
ncbi:hypothetical protein BY996DRAFT_408861 [Phakopsora pachyrhizi]|nr:hypothetical protein BY996DRAFT_408861 [Phakopsora pachyrhizi]